jgi:hypothetical protein
VERVADRKRSALNRKGDLKRTAWRPPGKTRGTCLDCIWKPAEGIGYPNVARQCRDHAREKDHRTRLASVEVVEYKPTGEPGITKANWGRPKES